MRSLRFGGTVSALGSVLIFVGGCAEEQSSSGSLQISRTELPKTLYDRLGGEQAIRGVVNDFVDRVLADAKVNFTRKGTGNEWRATPGSVGHFKKHLVNYISQSAGGPQKYRGDSMKSAHRGMQIREAEFDAMVADLKITLDKLKIPSPEREELVKIVDSTRSDIVEASRP